MISVDDFLAISRLDNRYWASADMRSDEPAESLFTPTGVLKLASLELEGKEAIGRFFVLRQEQQVSTSRHTRHLGSGMTINPLSRERVTARSVVVVFAGCGALPLQSDVPSTLADVEDIYMRCSDGEWRFEKREISPIFVGPAAASFARK